MDARERTSGKIGTARWRYITDETVTLKTLAEELGISYPYLKNKAAHERWAEQRQEFQRMVMEKASAKVADEVARLAEEHRKIARKAMEVAQPIFEGKVGELTPFQAWSVIREAVELERKSTGLDEQVKAQVVEHLVVLLNVAKTLLQPEQFEELRTRLLEASGVG
ncbi:hypothetical protein EG19_10935 [Thermoanaerobaculum aquaticum]|uniref:Uncharacterized protein n=1 Tax=Thermoanaerobaculum aquaticum TaxID=1312852 RepID=A0A062Y143_9BACT|nr:hypothetical protein [Thermoanaerobaculum aquaticum]KDA54480.1 hypothetical protein EG19_10935 [Thermoanaerobaculum aquaticum]